MPTNYEVILIIPEDMIQTILATIKGSAKLVNMREVGVAAEQPPIQQVTTPVKVRKSNGGYKHIKPRNNAFFTTGKTAKDHILERLKQGSASQTELRKVLMAHNYSKTTLSGQLYILKEAGIIEQMPEGNYKLA